MEKSQMIEYLREMGLLVTVVPNSPDMLHVDGYHGHNAKGLPDWLWRMPGWTVSTCGFGRVFLTNVDRA
jgi:hypothetical protein